VEIVSRAEEQIMATRTNNKKANNTLNTGMFTSEDANLKPVFSMDELEKSCDGTAKDKVEINKLKKELKEKIDLITEELGEMPELEPQSSDFSVDAEMNYEKFSAKHARKQVSRRMYRKILMYARDILALVEQASFDGESKLVLKDGDERIINGRNFMFDMEFFLRDASNVTKLLKLGYTVSFRGKKMCIKWN
jgi:hypothetical protein